MLQDGTTAYLIIGGKLVCELPMVITDISETWDTILSRGELAGFGQSSHPKNTDRGGEYHAAGNCFLPPIQQRMYSGVLPYC